MLELIRLKKMVAEQSEAFGEIELRPPPPVVALEVTPAEPPATPEPAVPS
jgi:hypothetical protein